MKRILILGCLACLLAACHPTTTNMKASALKEDLQFLQIEPLHYVCYRTDAPITIDGQLADKPWDRAKWTSAFVDIEGDPKPRPDQQTRVKMLWDDEYLYIAAELEETHIWATLENHDDIIFHDNDFEVFLDPDNDAKNYFEYEVNAKGTVFDLFLPHPYRHSPFAVHTWDLKNVKQGIYIDGTLNNGADVDKKWTVELAIPFASLRLALEDGKPDVNRAWRVNFSRVQWDTRWENGKYVKLTDKEGRNLPEHNWVWSPVGRISMHMPERYGYLKFSNHIVGQATEEYSIPEKEKLKNALWAVYYRQDAFYLQHQRYSSSLAELGGDIKLLYDPSKFDLHVTGVDTTFEAALKGKDNGIHMYITSEGSIIDKSRQQ